MERHQIDAITNYYIGKPRKLLGLELHFFDSSPAFGKLSIFPIHPNTITPANDKPLLLRSAMQALLLGRKGCSHQLEVSWSRGIGLRGLKFRVQGLEV